MKMLYVRRGGEIVECGDDFDLVEGRGMSAAYIRRLVDAVEPNIAHFIDLEYADRSPESMRMTFAKIAKEMGAEIKTFNVGKNIIGFVICKPESVFI